MTNIKLFKSLFTVSLVALSFQASATTITVNSTADAVAGDGWCTLREAIENANNDNAIHGDCVAGSGDDVIDLTGISGTITLGSQLVVDSNIDFKGPGANKLTLSGGGVTRVFYIYNHYDTPTVSIDEVTIVDSVGGGIYNEGDLNVTNSTLSGNSGGGINNDIANLTITNSTLSRNSGGGINSLAGDVTITNSILSENSAGYGGGINSYAEESRVTIINSTLLGNSAKWDGGGIYNQDSRLTITNSTLLGNSALESGGGIHHEGMDSLTVTNSTLSGNSAKYGGGINNLSYISITNSTLSGNSARYGGGINNIEYGYVDLTNTIIANSNSGGDCYNSGNFTIKNTLIEDGSCNPTWSGDPKLGPLADNGGSTLTHALLSGSIAIDTGNDTICAAKPVNGLDQRGVRRSGRLVGNHCDLGAFEYSRVKIIGGIDR